MLYASASGNQAKKRSTLVEPRTAGWREVEVEPSPFLWPGPSLHSDAFIRAVIVHDEHGVQISGKFGFQMVEEPDELPAAVPVLTGANHLAIEDVECSEKSRRAMALIIFSLAL